MSLNKAANHLEDLLKVIIGMNVEIESRESMVSACLDDDDDYDTKDMIQHQATGLVESRPTKILT